MSRSLDCPQLLGERKFPLPGSGYTLITECSALAIPTLRFSILCLVCSFRFRLCISIRVRHSSFSRGHPSGNARGGKCMCLTHPPVRAQNRREEKKGRRTPCKIKFWNTKPRAQFFQLA